MRPPHLPFLLLLGLLAGCAVGPDSARPVAPVPESYDSAAAASAATSDLAWWELFDDPVLLGLLETVARDNPDLAAATARVRAARQMAIAAGAPLHPTIQAGAGAQRAEQSAEGLNPLVGAKVPALPVDLPDRTETLYRAGLDASWEIDLFGRHRQAAEAAEARAEGVALCREDLLRSLLAETGRSYLEYRTTAVRLTLLERNLEILRQTEALARKRFDAGLATELDALRARSTRLALEARRPALATERDTALRALAVLTALEPSALRDRLEGEPGLPRADKLLGVGLPSELVRRRPDIRAAERAVAAAAAEVGVATADLYPRLTLVGSLGFESIDAGTLGEAASRFWSLGPRLSAPLLNGGALRARRAAKAAELDAALAAYEATVLRALREVEGAATQVFHAREEQDVRAAAVEAATTAQTLAQKRYDAGLIPLDQLLAIEMEHNQAEEQATLAEAREALAVISLGKALGSAWSSPATP